MTATKGRCAGRMFGSLALAQLLFCVFATPVLAQAPGPTPAPALGDPDGPEATIATTLSATDRMLVPVTIGGQGPYQFIVDTASERTVISKELSDKLALRTLGRATVLSLTASRPTPIVDMQQVSYMPGSSHNLQAVTLYAGNIGAVGILGIDALRGQRVVLDFEAQKMTVSPSKRRELSPAPNEIVVRARRRLGQLILAECTIGGQPVDVIIDSGTQVSVGNEALRRLLASRHPMQPISLLSVTGEYQAAEYTIADRLVIGQAEFIGMPVAFADTYLFSRLKLNRTPALLLGMDALQLFSRVSVDFQNNEARFVFPRKPTGRRS